ncbi:aminopeptidase P family protein [Arcticibacterium luteifluviistationis]|uniref:Xaa-Pro aminopeptidase n=1 Tax=Arcticibacterium luteifluviistationis TaxID=1784714 RepID=A0A2Z4G8Q2_9BACT|nr:aminopeptidase P family protein [Arcticibacterium luteifluviistationis]AWV97534.1 X-Pro aminopeptidase [Arcticibacterium luteifluviistationis]
MRYTPLPKELYIKNRKKLKAALKKNSIALLTSNDVLPTNADGIMGFKQNSDLFYLTGIDQEETYLLLFPDHPKKKFREILFIRETNEHLKIWEGEKLSKEQAQILSGIETVKWSDEIDDFLDENIDLACKVYLNTNEHTGRNEDFISENIQFNKWIRKAFGVKKPKKLAPILWELRSVKEPDEIAQIKKAIAISKSALQAFAQKLKPGIPEYELEAELTYQFLLNKSRGHAFQPIVASGKNACVLHYISNDEACQDGDLVLLDFGAEYGNYNADITRCFPVNGKFTKRQKDVYNAVLAVFKYSKERIVVGNTMANLRQETARFMEKQLVSLGLLTQKEIDKQDPKKPLYRKYFPHGVSHYLGLDVHDVGPKDAEFKAGMLFTCEPGIYISEEGIGIRLENDILITENGNIDLAADIPIEVADIEAMMAKA